MMIFILIAAIIGIITATYCRYLIRNETISNIIVIISIVMSFVVTKVFIYPMYADKIFYDILFKANPGYKIIADRYPKEFNQNIAQLKTFILKTNKLIYSYDNLTFIDTIFTQSVPTASNKSIYDFYTAKVALEKKLFLINPEFVLFIEFAHKFKSRPNPGMVDTLIGNDVIKSAALTKENVILSSIKNPAPPLSDDQRKTAVIMIQKIMSDLSRMYGDKVLENMRDINPRGSNLDKKQAALVMMSFNEKILNTGIDNAGLIIRYLASIHTSQ
jgi:hypothetical protein